MTFKPGLPPFRGLAHDRIGVGESDAGEAFPIGLVHWAFAPVVGGVETHLAEYAELLARRGHRVVVFTGTRDARRIRGVEHLYHRMLDLHWYSDRPTPREEERSAREFADWLGGELTARAIRVVHAHNLHYFTPIPALALNMLQRDLGLVLHHTYHSVWDDPDDIARVCSSWPGQYAFSKYIQGFCREHLDVSPQLTRPGIIVNRFSAAGLPRRGKREYVVLHPARLVEEKGADISIRMIHRLRASGLPARLILTDTSNIVDWNGGQAMHRKKMEALISELGIGEFVEFQEMPFAQMPLLYAGCDVVVYPSRYPEPLGLVPLEAGAAARPVIVTSLGGLPETVLDGKTGYVISPDDLEALVHRAELLWSRRRKARRMAKTARAHVKSEFELEGYLQNMIDLYRATSATSPPD